MTPFKPNTQQHSYQYLTYLLGLKKRLNDQVLLISIESIIVILLLLISSTLHANNYAREHRVKSGETIWGIARQNNLTVQDIYTANGISNKTTIHPGQVIKLPGARKVVVKSTQPKVVTNHATGNKFKVHTVQPRETLYRIALNTGVSEESIKNANQLSNSSIYPGQKLVIPTQNKNTQSMRMPQIRKAHVSGFNREFSTQQELLNINNAKSRYSVYRTATSTYDIFDNKKYVATVRDNYKSAYTKRKDGIFYNKGTKVTYNYIRSLGYDEATARALSFVSSNEGSASALNFYDGAGSFGFIQFTIKYGSFQKFVALLKENDDIAYNNYLKKYGIVLENNNLVVYAPEGYKGKTRITGETAIIDYIIKTKSLYGPLIELGENTKAAQVESARQQYMAPILKSQLNLDRLNSSITINQLINSSIGVIAVTDLAVKLGVRGATNEIANTLNKYLATSTNPYYSLKNLSNYQLVKLVAETTKNNLVKRRMTKLLQQTVTQNLYI